MSDTTHLPDILIVDDSALNLRLLSDIVKSLGYKTRPVPSGKLALQAAANDPPDLVLLDLNMPEMDGFEVCRRFKEDELLKEIPIIFISALNKPRDKVRAFGAGGVDYVTKPFQVEEVEARIKTHLCLRQLRIERQDRNLRLAKSLDQLRELEALRDSLTDMIVHELRTPLAAIKTSMQLLLKKAGKELDEEIRRDIDLSLHGTTRLLRMINDLLDISRMEADQMPLDLETCDLVPMVREVVESMPAISATCQIRVPDGPSGVHCACDPELIRRVIANLLGNAVQHSPKGTAVELSVVRAGDVAKVIVKDRGRGIPLEVQQKIFEKLGRAEMREERGYHSMGLGLAFCKLAIEAHGGEIVVQSEPGLGSTFWFKLPIKQR